MKVSFKNVLIFSFIIIGSIFLSYYVFTSGITNNLVGSIESLTAKINDGTLDDVPIITSVINSSGEEFVNTDIAITIQANSKYNINKVQYSYDLNKWITVNNELNEQEINYKMIFKKDVNKTIYVRVVNVKGYESYPYETTIMIDKTNPTILVNKKTIHAKDETGLASIQYSNDKLEWVDYEVYGKEVILENKNINYKYVRVVDKVGNISKIKKVGN